VRKTVTTRKEFMQERGCFEPLPQRIKNSGSGYRVGNTGNRHTYKNHLFDS